MSRSITSIRSFSSSSRRQLPPMFPSSSPLPISKPSAPPSSSSTVSPAERSQAITDLSNLFARRNTTEIDKRRFFYPRDVVPPRELSNKVLYAERNPPARDPLFPAPIRILKTTDPFYITKTKPIEHALNPQFAAAFVDPLGRIKKRTETGLTLVNQRRVAKMVKRARSMGVISNYVNRPSRHGLGYNMDRLY